MEWEKLCPTPPLFQPQRKRRRWPFSGVIVFQEFQLAREFRNARGARRIKERNGLPLKACARTISQKVPEKTPKNLFRVSRIAPAFAPQRRGRSKTRRMVVLRRHQNDPFTRSASLGKADRLFAPFQKSGDGFLLPWPDPNPPKRGRQCGAR